ncbi:hypothetical protein [Corynebacterium flavescens]|uniref:hypothetical protein n=1 Tax=Corynebacterium flavescens TaxID=28028 RepID=UPI0026492A02|nr:hypothetical protein [Corynebacterium flavescens]MDN6198442.1 plasmid pRiA4b ORF-3 family protein [Corynebacterium flavescens]MDN6226346.1 plasmid pRiA4b ORF-3 family protein [Corynebacterium flavescens]MDN6235702.1 plasmid pRiA4b ORF-3 family protein [Corynebacterium flavescens]MDN6431714.1 plasmid pRiA4b ORF-3 family protein [Corynebacterium flavescens]MDN6475267.1 plasmid pRiA4b ORF-3 family protein [Corynebacterium flavescens]
MSYGVTDLARARARRAGTPIQLRREPLTIICQVANIRADAEVHRQIGFSDALTFNQLHRVLSICFSLPKEDSPWHFFEHVDARGARIDPRHQISEFLWREGDQVDFSWGLWDFEIVVAEIYPRDSGTPRALCVGGSGSLFRNFDLTAINAELTGQETIAEVLNMVAPPVRRMIERTKLYDFVPLLQALDLNRPVEVSRPTRHTLRSLPREVTTEGQDAFWAMALALSCLGGKELTDSVVETAMEALGWVDDDGRSLTGEKIRALCSSSLSQLERVGAYGPAADSPVDRLDVYRALLHG